MKTFFSQSNKAVYFKYIIIFLPVLLTACGVSPKKFTVSEQSKQFVDNLTSAGMATPPISKQLSLHHAIARAVKFNLDYRVYIAEQAIAQTDLSVTNLNTLPNLIANGGYVDRNNVNAVLSPVTGQVSTAESRVRWLGDMSFSWNILDFGVSYFEAKQKADQVLIAEQKRREMLQRLAKDTRISFWRAMAAQNYIYNSNGFKSELKEAVKLSEQAQSEKHISPIEAARYRRYLWAVYNQITKLRYDLARAKPELMSLVMAPSGSHVKLKVDKQERIVLPKNLPPKLEQLEEIALFLRPELQEENYRKRISLNEIHKARVRLLPGLELNYGSYYDSNSFLVNNDWKILGLSLTWNILKSFANLKGVTLAKQQAILSDVRRLALSMAIITQVDISKAMYDMAKEQLYTSRKLLESEEAVYKTIQKQAEVKLENKLSLTLAKAGVILTKLKYDLAYTDYQAAGATLIHSLGMDPMRCISSVNLPIEQLTKEIHETMINGTQQTMLLKVEHGKPEKLMMACQKQFQTKPIDELVPSAKKHAERHQHKKQNKV
jgi:outer membrane protein TolC